MPAFSAAPPRNTALTCTTPCVSATRSPSRCAIWGGSSCTTTPCEDNKVLSGNSCVLCTHALSSFFQLLPVWASSSANKSAFTSSSKNSSNTRSRYWSILLKTIMVGLSVTLRSAKVLFTTSIWSSCAGWLMSTTCSSMSLSRTSSNVDLKLSIKWWGNLRINPPVSDSKKGTISITTLRTVVSKVANSLFSANTSDLLKMFMSVLLPTLV